MPTRPKSFHERFIGRTGTDAAYEATRRQTDQVLTRAASILRSRRWRNRSAWYRRRHPICEDPFGHHATSGAYIASLDVHHKVP